MQRTLAATAAGVLLCAVAAGTGAGTAHAQDRIDKPVKILVGFAPGGTADIIARVVAEKMGPAIGQPVIVENRPGAIGRITADAVKAAAPDGTTLMVMPIGPMAVVPHVYRDITYDPVKDFTPVALGATFQFAIAAGPASGAKTWSEFATWAKANPGKAAYATSGAGSLPHFFGVLLGRGIGVEMVHVPYKGSAAYLNDLVGGQVPVAIDAIADLTELHRAGKVKVLASSGAKRSTALPDVPTFSELGVAGVEAMGWFGFFAPAKTPKPIVDALNAAINKALTSPDVAEKLSKLGMDPATGSPESFARVLAEDYAKWGPIVKASGFKAE
ncbi:MAG: Bug family tripartite tricarboxylate transporter substrate binding protein [Burkholderiales bacterium]|nr:Bug family tripartite tricarboxylate transporter substrate binding protein [Burkholderiales bacterium]